MGETETHKEDYSGPAYAPKNEISLREKNEKLLRD